MIGMWAAQRSSQGSSTNFFAMTVTPTKQAVGILTNCEMNAILMLEIVLPLANPMLVTPLKVATARGERFELLSEDYPL